MSLERLSSVLLITQESFFPSPLTALVNAFPYKWVYLNGLISTSRRRTQWSVSYFADTLVRFRLWSVSTRIIKHCGNVQGAVAITGINATGSTSVSPTANAATTANTAGDSMLQIKRSSSGECKITNFLRFCVLVYNYSDFNLTSSREVSMSRLASCTSHRHPQPDRHKRSGEVRQVCKNITSLQSRLRCDTDSSPRLMGLRSPS